MMLTEDNNLQRTVHFIDRDGCPKEKQMNNIIKTILKLQINETLLEDNHKIYCCKQELGNRAIHGQYLCIEMLLFSIIAVSKTYFVPDFLIISSNMRWIK